ncbi:MAG: IS3 family transposase [Solirubrobacterales bacterium]
MAESDCRAHQNSRKIADLSADLQIGSLRNLRAPQITTQLELAVVEYIAWFNNDRLRESLGDLPPAEFEHLYVAQRVN